jgi:hypothetical protein
LLLVGERFVRILNSKLERKTQKTWGKKKISEKRGENQEWTKWKPQDTKRQIEAQVCVENPNSNKL